MVAAARGPEIGESVNAAGVETNVHISGAGAPVVLLHGSGPGVTAWANWRFTMPALAERRRVIAPDLLGFGYTARPEGTEYTLEAWVGHLLALLDELGLERVDLLGNSFGGGLALRFARDHPDRVARLILMGSVGIEFELTEGLDLVWGYTPSLEGMRELLHLFVHDDSLINEELVRSRYEASAVEEIATSYAEMFPAPRQEGITRLATPESDIASIDKSTLIIHGREDRVIPHSNSQRLFELIASSDLHMFGQCGHWTQIEHAQRFNRLVADFLDS